MTKKVTKLVIDTNLWISFFISRSQDNLTGLLESGQIQLIFSRESLNELFEVIQRKKFSKSISVVDVLAFFERIENQITIINPTSRIRLCRDPEDDFLINLALDSSADFLITGDKDLLVLDAQLPFKVITMRQFIDGLT